MIQLEEFILNLNGRLAVFHVRTSLEDSETVIAHLVRIKGIFNREEMGALFLAASSVLKAVYSKVG